MCSPEHTSPERAADGLLRWRVSEILFDMDGTLIDSIAAVEYAWTLWSAEFGVDLTATAGSHGRTAAELVSEVVAPDLRQAALQRLIDIESNMTGPVPLRPGAASLLASLPHDRWGIVTSASRAVADARHSASGMPHPGVFVTADDVAHGKPSPEPFVIARRRQRSGLPAMAFEDSVAGLMSARQAGYVTIGVIGTSPTADLVAEADAVIASLADVRIAETTDGAHSACPDGWNTTGGLLVEVRVIPDPAARRTPNRGS